MSGISGAREFVAALNKAKAGTAPAVEGVLFKGAMNIKRDWQAALRGSKHFAPVARAVTFDERVFSGFGSTVFAVEVGIDKGHPGSLGNIAHFGTSRGGGTVADPQTFLDDEAPRLAEHLAREVAKTWQ